LLQTGAPAPQDESASAAAARISLTARLLQDAETFDPEAAASRFRAAQKELPPDAWYIDADQMEAVGASLLREGQASLALIVYELYAEAFPDYPRAHCLLGTACLRAGKNARAGEAYVRARELIGGKHPREIAMLIRMDLRQCIYEDGTAKLPARFTALRADYASRIGPALLNELGYELIGAGKTADAVALFRLNVAEFPEYANGYDSLGEGYALMGDTQLAIESYERVLELDPDNQNAVEMLERLREN
jgi:Flp pilus assembly protein TadD